MRALDPALCKALPLSLLLHAILLAASGWLIDRGPGPITAPQAQLDVTLQPASETPQPQLFQAAAPQPALARAVVESKALLGHSAKAPSKAIAEDAGPVLAGEAAREANRQLARELLYPPEAIARGLEGQALVLLFLDASGNAVAARLETSSGHALLDDAAVRAARTLHALPDSAPREALLPVRFRLR